MAIDYKAIRAKFKVWDRVRWTSPGSWFAKVGTVVAVLEPSFEHREFLPPSAGGGPRLDARIAAAYPHDATIMFDHWVPHRGGVIVEVKRTGARGQALKPYLYQPYVTALEKVEAPDAGCDQE